MILFPLVLMTVGISLGLPVWDETGLRLGHNISHAACYALIALASMSVLFSLIGLIKALIGKLPVGLSIGGLVASFIALALMILFMLALHRIADDMCKELPNRTGWQSPAKNVNLPNGWPQPPPQPRVQ